MNTSKVVITAKGLFGKICSIIGWIWGVFWVIAIIVALAEGTYLDSFVDVIATLIIAGIFVAPAVVLIMIGHRIKQRIRRFRSYVSVLASKDGSAHVEELALAVTRPPAFVAREVMSMVNQRYFANANFNHATGVVTINRQFDPNAYTQPVMGMPTTGMHTPSAPSHPPIIESFTCTGCSAVGSRKKGFHGECDYCGTVAS